MSDLRAKVKDGRLVLDEPTDLPEGTVLDLVVDDEGDDLDAAGRAALDQAIESAWKQALAGQVQSADDVLRGLRSKR